MLKHAVTIAGVAMSLTLISAALAAPDAQVDAKAVSADAGQPTGGGSVEGPTEGPTEGPIDQAKGIWSAFKGGKYREAIAGAITLLVFLWRRYFGRLIIGKLSPWWLGFVTVLLGYVATIPEALSTSPFSWWAFVWSGLLTSAQAMLMWQMVGKKVLPKVFGAAKADG